MERLPYIDAHTVTIAAPAERVWPALVSVLRTDFGRSLPAPVAYALAPSARALGGEWRGTPQLGDTLPGFSVAEVSAPERLVLCGQHRFSRYELAFELREEGGETCTLQAATRAAFPGVRGRVYRAFVIDSQGHRLLVRRLLRRIAARV